MVVLMNMETGEVERVPRIEASEAHRLAAGNIAVWPPMQARLAEVCTEHRPLVRPLGEPVDRFLVRMVIAGERRRMGPELA